MANYAKRLLCDGAFKNFIMTEKQKYIGAYLDGYFSDKKLEYGFAYFNHLEKATKKAKKKFKQYKKQNKL